MTAQERRGAVLALAVFALIVAFLLFGIAARVMSEPIQVDRGTQPAAGQIEVPL
jgi:hypothetical protein